MKDINLLIIEDSKSFNKTLASLLKRYGYIITQAYTFSEAKNIIKKNKFDFVLLDLLLPDGEGDELIFEIKDVSDAKIIVLSGMRDIQRRNYLFEQGGVIDYFSKEMPLKLLIQDIHDLIETVYLNSNSNILVIDDSAFVRRSIKSALESKNYNILTANDPKEAWGVLAENHIDLIFSDLEMPHMSGVEFTEKLKNEPAYKDIPVLILSSSDNREEYARVLKHGAVDFIKKPFILEEIILKCDLHIKQSNFINKMAAQAKELDEYKRVLDESDIVSKADLKGRITYANNKFLEITGFSEDELIGKQHNIVRHPDVPKEVFKDMWNKIQNKQTFKGIVKNKRRNGSSYYVDATIVPILDIDGNIKEYIGVRHDVTDIMNPKKQFLDDLANKKDPIAILGKIKNYFLLKEFYGESFMQMVEDFIYTNILLLVPEKSPLNKVYYLENGEFAFLRDSCDSQPSDIEICLEEFKYNISSHDFIVDDKKIDINFFFSFTTKKENAFENLKIGIRKAGKENLDIVFSDNFAEKNKEKAQNNMQMIDVLKKAVNKTNGVRIVSHFQPVLNNKTNEIEKYESLVRLINEDGSITSPYFFIDIAKKAGYYKDITDVVLDNSFEALDKTDKEVTINLSTIDIEDINVRNKLLGLITQPNYYGRVVFELLEDEIAKEFSLVKDFISLAKVVGGVKIAIDDFGSGYSNFERLVDFQPDILKIDGSLIKNICTDSFSEHVVQAIVLFAQKENIQTVAEFIADEDIFVKVKSMGIDYSQGFYIGKPEPLREEK